MENLNKIDSSPDQPNEVEIDESTRPGKPQIGPWTLLFFILVAGITVGWAVYFIAS